jgi:hypothetical protein
MLRLAGAIIAVIVLVAGAVYYAFSKLDDDFETA